MAKYRHKYKNFGDEVLRAPWMVAEMAARAKRVEEAAVADAQTYRRTGHYAASFESGARVGRSGSRGSGSRRAIGYVRNTDPAALTIEFGRAIEIDEAVATGGTGHEAGHHTLLRALDAAG